MPNEFEPPKSRIEAILQNMLGAENVLQPPQSRVEYYLMKILEEGLGSEVVANPTLEGTEDPLTSIEIEGVKFVIPAELPSVTPEDVGKFLRVSLNGLWIAATVPSAENQSF